MYIVGLLSEVLLIDFCVCFLQCFGLFNTIAYGAGAYFLYMEWKSGNAAAQ